MQLKNKIPVAVLGATGMVGQRFVQLLENHPWFTLEILAASANSAGKSYAESVKDRWYSSTPLPSKFANLIVKDAQKDVAAICSSIQLVFSAVSLEKEQTRRLEEQYASLGALVVSNNSAHRWTPDVPLLIPEVNPEHCEAILVQRKNRNWKRGGIAVKPNCSIQSYVPILHCWKSLGLSEISVTSLQAISGAGKTLATCPEIVDNVIPYIEGEEEKSQKEPLKIWGKVGANGIEAAVTPKISATCLRVPVSDGHMASVGVNFEKKVELSLLREKLLGFENPLAKLDLPSAPVKLIHLFDEQSAPQTKVHRDLEKGMSISIGRLRNDQIFDVTFIGLSHNTLRGAAGGAVLMAELFVQKGLL